LSRAVRNLKTGLLSSHICERTDFQNLKKKGKEEPLAGDGKLINPKSTGKSTWVLGDLDLGTRRLQGWVAETQSSNTVHENGHERIYAEQPQARP